MTVKGEALTVIVPAGNRRDLIEDCLKSVAWADELLVVDSFSDDGTFELAQQVADRVLRHEYVNSALQKNWAIPQAAHEWVLILDTDERVTAELRQEIQQILAGDLSFAGYKIPRINYFLGEPVIHTGYYPDYQTRLFRRDSGRYELRQVHAHVLLDGPLGTLESPLVHYAHQSLDQTLRNLLILMTTWEAEQRIRETARAGRSAKRMQWPELLLRPAAAFALRFFKQSGWRDGMRGLVLSLIWAMYVAITYMKVWENSLELPPGWWHSDWQRRQGKNGGD